MRLVHFADLHLDAPFAWASRQVADRRRANRRRSLELIIELAEREQADAILSGGDLFEHDLIGPDTVEFLRVTFERARRPVYLAPGNHDWYGPDSPYARAAWPDNVYLFVEDHFEPVELGQGVTLWGAAHRAPANTDDFFDGFRVAGEGTHLALAHASEKGALQFQEPTKRPHAPFERSEIAEAGFDYALLGHYHSPRDEERFSYPGNPDPLEFGETGDRGALVVDVAGNGDISVARHRVAVSQVHDIDIDVDGSMHRDEVAARITSAIAPLSGCVRATLRGELAPSVEFDHRSYTNQVSHLDALIIQTHALTYGYDLEAIKAEPTVRGQFVVDAEAIEDTELRRRVIIAGLRALDGRDDLDAG